MSAVHISSTMKSITTLIFLVAAYAAPSVGAANLPDLELRYCLGAGKVCSTDVNTLVKCCSGNCYSGIVAGPTGTLRQFLNDGGLQLISMQATALANDITHGPKVV